MRPHYGSDNPNQNWLNIGRDGTVYDRRNGTNGPEVKVYYPDKDVLTDWIPVKQMGSAGTAFHFCPRVGDNVTVLHLGSGIEQGTVIGGHGTDNNPVFIPNTIDSIAMASEDGTFIEHEPQSSTFTLAGVQSFHLSVNGDSIEYVGGVWTVNIGGNVNITSGGTATVTANEVIVKAPTIVLVGSVEIQGPLKVDGTTNLAGGGVASPSLRNTDGSGGGS